MARFVRLIAVFLLIQLAVLGVVMAVGGPSTNYLAGAIDKQRLLAETPSPRVVLVGDSSLAFGVDSATVEAMLGGRYHVVNMGLHGGLGLDLMLNQALDGIRPGDVVVVSPTYETLWHDTFQPIEAGELLRLIPGDLRFVAPRHHLRLALSMLSDQPLVALHDLVTTAVYRLTGQTMRGVYYRSSFNRWGDDTAARWLTDYVSIARADDRADDTEPELARNLASLKLFAEEARHRGASVFFALPPVEYSRLAANRARIDRTVSRIRTEAGITVIDSPEDVAFSAGSFFDSPDHLRGEAVAIRSRHLAVALRAALLRQVR